MIWPAVRVEKAFPPDERYAPVIALVIAASDAGIVPAGIPSRPPVTPRPPQIAIVAGAPVREKPASTLPTRSTTATCARIPRACASPTAWAMTRCTSASVRKLVALSQPATHALTPPPPDDPEHAATRHATASNKAGALA